RSTLLLASFPTRRSSDLDLFEGKYYGSLVPWLEARRYIYIHLLTLGLAGIGSGSFLLTLLSLIAAYSFYNFMLHSAHLGLLAGIDRKSTRLNSSHVKISY